MFLYIIFCLVCALVIKKYTCLERGFSITESVLSRLCIPPLPLPVPSRTAGRSYIFCSCLFGFKVKEVLG